MQRERHPAHTEPMFRLGSAETSVESFRQLFSFILLFCFLSFIWAKLDLMPDILLLWHLSGWSHLFICSDLWVYVFMAGAYIIITTMYSVCMTTAHYAVRMAAHIPHWGFCLAPHHHASKVLLTLLPRKTQFMFQHNLLQGCVLLWCVILIIWARVLHNRSPVA